VADGKYLDRKWNIYAPAVIPDVDEDGIADLVVVHGGGPDPQVGYTLRIL